ncbi:MAG: hypothetical protein WC711_02970 [Candidatus Staskawiczbacteria bacterium]|jgi:hypothetical protein
MGEIPRQEESLDQAQDGLEINTLKSEHLAEGVKPIIACVGTKEQYGEQVSEITQMAVNVDYYADSSNIDEDWYKNEGTRPGYVISAIDEFPKFTEKLYGCTSLVAVGIDSKTGKEVSFLTHQDSYRTINEPFQKDLEKRLRELKMQCREGTIDVVIVGGELNPKKMKAMFYQESLEALSSVVEKSFGFSPVVACGPKEPGSGFDYDNAYFDTENRRLYMIRPESKNLYNDSFNPGQINEVNEKWKRDKLEK